MRSVGGFRPLRERPEPGKGCKPAIEVLMPLMQAESEGDRLAELWPSLEGKTVQFGIDLASGFRVWGLNPETHTKSPLNPKP